MGSPVLRGKAAAIGLVPKMARLPPAAGMAAGDEWVAVEHADGTAWRVQQLDDLLTLGGSTTSGWSAWVSRDRRLVKLAFNWPADVPQSITLGQPADRGDDASRWPAAAG